MTVVDHPLLPPLPLATRERPRKAAIEATFRTFDGRLFTGWLPANAARCAVFSPPRTSTRPYDDPSRALRSTDVASSPTMPRHGARPAARVCPLPVSRSEDVDGFAPRFRGARYSGD